MTTKKVISDTTRRSYERAISRYYDKINDDPINVYNAIKSSGIGLGSVKNALCAIKWYTGDDRYGELINELRNEINESKKDNVNKFKKINLDSIKIDYTKNNVNTVITGLYTLIPPRRIEDYAYMLYIETPKDEGIFNYYVVSTNEFVFKKYKTVHKFGIQRFKVPKELQIIIMKYAKHNELQYGNNLLQYNGRKNKFSEKTLRNRLNKIFGVSVDGIRHAYVTEIYKNPKNLLRIKEISEKMGHTIPTHVSYIDKDRI